MNVAVCVPYRPRNDHEVRVWGWCRGWWAVHYPDWPVVDADSGHDPFNRSASRNTAVSMLGGWPDTIVFANADTVAGDPTEMATAVDIATSGGWCLPARYVETSEDWTTCTLAEPPDHPLFDPFAGCDRQLVDAIAGPQIMPYEWFVDVGGWDQRFPSWGWERQSS